MFHVGKYLHGLARAFTARGGHIETGVQAVAVEEGEIARVKLDNGREIRARHVVVATNTPFIDRVKMHTKQAAYRTYVVGFRGGRGKCSRLPAVGSRGSLSLRARGAERGRRRRAHRRRRGSQDRPGRSARPPLRQADRVGARALSRSRRCEVPLVRPGHGAHRRPRLHRPQPGRRQHLRRDRRLGQRHDAWHARRACSSAISSRGARTPGPSSTIRRARPCRRRDLSSTRTPMCWGTWSRTGSPAARSRNAARYRSAPAPSCAKACRCWPCIATTTGAFHELLGRVHAPRLRRAMERRGTELGLPVPRLALRSRRRRSAQWPGGKAPRAPRHKRFRGHCSTAPARPGTAADALTQLRPARRPSVVV